MDPVKRKLKIYNNYNYNTNYILVFHFATGTLKWVWLIGGAFIN